MRDQEIIGLWEAYQQVYSQPEEVEQLDESRTDPRGRPASGPMSVYGGKGTPSPDPEGDDNISKMDRAQRRVKRTQPRAKGMAADALFTKYSARQKGMEHGGEEGPGPKAPKRSGRSGRGANTDRGSGNAAQRRMSEDFDLFDVILEHLVAEGYADTNKAALAIMANMSEEWKQSIVEEVLDEAITSEKGKAKMKAMLDARTTASGRAKAGKGENVAQIKHIGRSEREGLRGTPMTPTMAKNPAKSRTFSGTGNKAARRAGTYED